MNKIFLYNAAGFIIGAVTFCNRFLGPNQVGTRIFLAFLVNIPNLIFLYFLTVLHSGTGSYSLLLPVGLGVIIGVGGFGLGAMAGMIFVFVRVSRGERPVMSASGQSRRFGDVRATSA
jgi:hypothetical protein